MVRRRRPEDNLRPIQISLTGPSRELAARLCPRAAHYERVAVRDFGAGDVERLKATLAKVYANLDEIEWDQAAKAGQSPHEAV